jgi:hypothetical protein
MRASQHSANPFDLLIDPEAVLRAVAASSPLGGLKRKVFRPLDKAQNPAAPTPEAERLDGDLLREDEDQSRN